MSRFRMLLLAIGCSVAAPAAAQFESSIGSDMAASNLQAELLQRRIDGAETLPADAAAELVFTVSPERRAANVRRAIVSLTRGQPEVRAELEALERSRGLVAIVGQGLAPYGLATDNLADAYAFWWINGWLAWAGDTSDQTREQARAVAGQAASALLATPTIAGASDAQQQDFADDLLIHGLMIGQAIEQMKADPSTRSALRTAMEQAGAAMGLDFSAMRLTADGFVAAGAAQAPPPMDRAAGSQAAGSRVTGAPIDSALSDRLIERVVFYQWGDLQFHPTILLKDGTAFDVDDASLEAEPPEVSRGLHPQAWGRWEGRGDRFVLIDAQGNRDENTLGEGTFLSFPGETGQRLEGSYQSVSGMQVGETSMLNSGRMTFLPGGRFTTRREFAASGSGDVTGVAMAGGSSSSGGGTYAISGHRIVLRHDDGRVQDLFFGFGGQGSPQRVDPDMIFLGDTGWLRD